MTDPDPAAAKEDDARTGLPLFRTWRAVYAFVLAAFALQVALLLALALAYR